MGDTAAIAARDAEDAERAAVRALRLACEAAATALGVLPPGPEREAAATALGALEADRDEAQAVLDARIPEKVVALIAALDSQIAAQTVLRDEHTEGDPNYLSEDTELTRLIAERSAAEDL